MIIIVIKNIKWLINMLYLPIFNRFKKYFDYYYLKYYGVDTELGFVTLSGLPIIHRHKNAKIILGKDVTLVSKSKFNSAGINHPVILASIRENSVLKIHGSFGASGSAIVAMNSIEIEEGVALGANSHIYDTDFHPVNWEKNSDVLTSPVKICKNVWVASNCLILKGVTIGHNSVIGAGSIVTKSLKSNALYAGIPAKLIRYF
jgi:acetyltransferase-like isoleucine patch superfamily enzyme